MRNSYVFDERTLGWSSPDRLIKVHGVLTTTLVDTMLRPCRYLSVVYKKTFLDSVKDLNVWLVNVCCACITNDGIPFCTHLLQLMATDQSSACETWNLNENKDLAKPASFVTWAKKTHILLCQSEKKQQQPNVFEEIAGIILYVFSTCLEQQKTVQTFVLGTCSDGRESALDNLYLNVLLNRSRSTKVTR